MDINSLLDLIRRSEKPSSALVAMLSSEDYKYDIAKAPKNSLYYTYKRRLELLEEMQDTTMTSKREAVLKLVTYLTITDDDFVYYTRFYSKKHYFIVFIDRSQTQVITIIENTEWQESDMNLI